ncbi:IS4 family transposase [Massilia psychrophila]|uniref:Transposase n=1 Tax=Massilia psychrophila TaxID=1603353 RepID=A0A2G8SWD9_9BURK|nr:IS4 family transposase [Massilia psychrophila]PIL38013.1 transposase [Massilia psychrophila]
MSGCRFGPEHVRSGDIPSVHDARHVDHPTAFSRSRKLPLATLVTLMLTGMRMRMSVQAELDTFFGHLRQQAQLVHEVSEQAFAQARAKLSLTAIPRLNDWLIARAEQDRFVPRWHGLRLVAADASTMRFGLRASHVKRAALADQILFGLFLPGPDLMLAASLHNVHECGERQFLFEHLDRLSPDDLLLLDRGYVCRWLVAVLNDRAIKFCMRVDNASGFTCVRTFMRSGAIEQVVMLPAPNKRDALDYECSNKPQRVRLVRNTSPSGEQRVLMTNLFDDKLFSANCFAELYHKRWGIEEAFKRLKHRLSLEHVTGLTQQAVAQDVAAKIVCDNLQALVALTAHADADLPETRRVNHAYAHTALKPLLPTLLLGAKIGRKVAALLRNLLDLIAGRTYQHRQNLSKPRNPGQKPHKNMSQKNC